MELSSNAFQPDSIIIFFPPFDFWWESNVARKHRRDAHSLEFEEREGCDVMGNPDKTERRIFDIPNIFKEVMGNEAARNQDFLICIFRPDRIGMELSHERERHMIASTQDNSIDPTQLLTGDQRHCSGDTAICCKSRRRQCIERPYSANSRGVLRK